VRINRFEQSLGKARELGFKFEMNARGQPGEAFQQPLDVGIRASFLGFRIDC